MGIVILHNNYTAGSENDMEEIHYVFFSGTEPGVPGFQKCRRIAISDYPLLLSAQRSMICGNSSYDYVQIRNGGCAEVTTGLNNREKPTICVHVKYFQRFRAIL